MGPLTEMDKSGEETVLEGMCRAWQVKKSVRISMETSSTLLGKYIVWMKIIK